MPKTLVRILKVAGAVIVLLAALLLLLQTPVGKSVLASQLSRSLSRPGNTGVRIEGISGWIPTSIHIDRVVVSDSEGQWLSVRNLHGRWVVRDLLKGRVRFRNLGATEVELIRFPKSESTASTERNGSSGFGRMELQFNELAVDHLRLGRQVAGTPLEYTVRSGGIVFKNGRLSGGISISGDAEGWVDLKAMLADPSGNRLTLRAELKRMNKPTFGLDRLSGTGEATVDADGVNARLKVAMEKDRGQGYLSTQLRYSDRQLHLSQVLFTNRNCSVTGNLDIGFLKDRVDLGVDASVTDAVNNSYALLGQAAVITSNKSWAVNVQSMKLRAWNAVSVTVSGSFDPSQVDMKCSLAEFDAGTLPFAGMSNFTGRVSGTVAITGTPDAPKLSAGLEVHDFASSANALDELPKLDFGVSAGIAHGKLFASTSITNFISGYLSANVAMPCSFSIVPFHFQPDTKQTDGSLAAILDMDVFNALASFDNQHLGGILTAELSLKKGNPSGFVKMEHGSYEHYEWGILFRDFNAELDAVPDGFVFKKAHATDGLSGNLGLSGGMHKGNVDMTLNLSSAKVIRRPDADATLSGKLSIAGRIRHPNISGKLKVERADLLPDNIVSSKPVLLTDYDAHAQTNAPATTRKRKSLPVGINIAVDMPDQIYVNASLIDSVWGGRLQLHDTPEGISIRGKLEPRRGYVAFIGKKFRFTDGDVELDGSVPPAPVMNNLTAEFTRSDITARLVLNGTFSNPQCLLSSTPAFPQDEILSQVLFKRDTSTISPYQAIQIASAAQQLSGGLNGPGFLYQFRQAVKIDTLEWREPDTANGSSSVVAGKYITPDLYVEVRRSVGAEAQTDLTAEYDIGRHFSVETSAGPKMRPGIGLNWKTDY